jgi:antitoxin component YwqK of YwqJK toxin-antitoxin module
MMTLDIVEIPYESGELKFRYARKMSVDGSRWIRDGLFQSYYQNGQVSSEGHYNDGLEVGQWTTYHENGQLASRGNYHNGLEADGWEYWDVDGRSEVAA